jgi:hypothetical protein
MKTQFTFRKIQGKWRHIWGKQEITKPKEED